MAEAPEPNTDHTKMAEAQGDLIQQFKGLDVSGIENKKIIDTMWNTVLNHRNGYKPAYGLANKTYLVCQIDGKTIIKENTKETQNTERKHAEINFIEYLQTNSVAGKHLTLSIYINNSPCDACANALKEYLTNNKDINFTIYVTHLYNIKRKSCQLNYDDMDVRKENHMDYITSHEATYNELKNLLSLGKERCTINPFTKEVWKDLHEVMGLTTEDSKHRMTTYATTKKNHDRSRETEDSYIKDDLIDLQENEDPLHEIQRNY